MMTDSPVRVEHLRPDDRSGRATRMYAFFVSFVASIGGFLFGYDLVIISGAQIYLRDQFALSPAQFGFATSSAVLGCIVGPSLGAVLCDRLGRKSTLLVASFLFVAGAIGSALPNDIGTFNVFRILGGVGVGLASIASPMYIAEIAPARSRGRLGIMYQLAITVGALAATVVAYYLAIYLPPDVSWRWMFASVAVPVVAFVGLLLFVPQSPRWLAEQGRYWEAEQVLARIDPDIDSHVQLEEIRSSLSRESGSLRELLEPSMRKPLSIGIVLAVLNNWTGWTSVAFYLPTLFQRAGYAEASAAIGQNVIVQAASVLMTAVAIWLVDRWGRRPLWLATSAAMSLSLLMAGLVFQLQIVGPLVVGVVLLCMAPHSIGLGPLPWLMMSEIYPTRIRARAVAVSTTFLWLAAFSGPYAFPMLDEASRKAIGSGAGVFWLYSAICVFSFLWALRFLPETKGRSLEQIGRLWTREP
ncbi:MAG: sugar porter family MFS transporter [Vicinamibacteraceae bacterium]